MMDAKRIERAAKKLNEIVQGCSGQNQAWALVAAQHILEAADTPEPQIEVTGAMEKAGEDAYIKRRGENDVAVRHTLDFTAAICDAYRAMRPLEPIPPFTEKMRDAMQAMNMDTLPSSVLREMYEAARKEEGK